MHLKAETVMKKIKAYMRGVFEVYCREFKIILHDPGVILFITFLPLVYPIIYSLIYNPELVKEVPMVIVDHDRTSRSRELSRRLDACDEVWVRGYAADMGEARRAMDSHKCFSILEIPEGYARNIGKGEVATAALYCDMTLLLRYRGFLVAATEVAQELGSEIQTEDINRLAPLAGTIVTGDLLPVENISMGNIRNGFDSFIMPGVLVLILHQCIVLAMGMLGGARRERSSLVGYNPHNNARSVSATMLGQLLCMMTCMALFVIYMLHYVPLMFKFPMAGNLGEELLFILPMMLACLGLGFVFQAFVTERESVFVSWVVTSVILLMLSGLIWPHYDMPRAWRLLADIFPSTWGVEGYIKMNTNGASLAQVRHEYVMLWILAAAWLAIGYVVQKWVVRPKTAAVAAAQS